MVNNNYLNTNIINVMLYSKTLILNVHYQVNMEILNCSACCGVQLNICLNYVVNCIHCFTIICSYVNGELNIDTLFEIYSPHSRDVIVFGRFW